MIVKVILEKVKLFSVWLYKFPFYLFPLWCVCRALFLVQWKLPGRNIGWIRIRNFCLDPDPELGKFKAGSGSGINHFGSTTLVFSLTALGNLAYTGWRCGSSLAEHQDCVPGSNPRHSRWDKWRIPVILLLGGKNNWIRDGLGRPPPELGMRQFCRDNMTTF